jgi:hypothetical protein
MMSTKKIAACAGIASLGLIVAAAFFPVHWRGLGEHGPVLENRVTHQICSVAWDPVVPECWDKLADTLDRFGILPEAYMAAMRDMDIRYLDVKHTAPSNCEQLRVRHRAELSSYPGREYLWLSNKRTYLVPSTGTPAGEFILRCYTYVPTLRRGGYELRLPNGQDVTSMAVPTMPRI